MEILHEDNRWLAVNKPSELSSEGCHEHWQARYPEIHLVHRLDLNTTGVLMFAKTPRDADYFRRSRPIKFYVCVAKETHPRDLTGTWQGFHRGQGHGALISEKSHPESKPIQQTVWNLSCHTQTPVSAYLIKLDTGKKHQIRAWFAHKGSALLGDRRYGDGKGFKRPALHALLLKIDSLKVIAPWPKDFSSCLKLSGMSNPDYRQVAEQALSL